MATRINCFLVGCLRLSLPTYAKVKAIILSIMQAGDLQKACAIAKEDPGSDLVPTQADFQERVQSLAAQLLQVTHPSPGDPHLVMLPADAPLCVSCA